jgi:hypothetical protein
MEEENLKKKYERPKVTRIALDAKCAVLGFCKSSPSGSGPATSGCDDVLGSPCLDFGS